jgi:hypothetical protein
MPKSPPTEACEEPEHFQKSQCQETGHRPLGGPPKGFDRRQTRQISRKAFSKSRSPLDPAQMDSTTTGMLPESLYIYRKVSNQPPAQVDGPPTANRSFRPASKIVYCNEEPDLAQNVSSLSFMVAWTKLQLVGRIQVSLTLLIYQ